MSALQRTTRSFTLSSETGQINSFAVTLLDFDCNNTKLILKGN